MDDFGGVWKTEWGDLVLSQEASFVRGQFAGAKLEGLILHGQLFFDWAKPEDNLAGKGVLQISGDQIQGGWGHGNSIEDGGPISGARIMESAPEEVPIEAAVEESPDDESVSSAIEEKADELRAQAQAKIDEAKALAQQRVKEAEEAARQKIDEFEESIPEPIKSTDVYEDAREQIETVIEDSIAKAEDTIDTAESMAESELETHADAIADAAIKTVEEVQDVANANIDELNDVMSRLNSAIMSSERASIITTYPSEPVKLGMRVDRIDSTVGYGIDDSLRGGKTVIGTVSGIEHPVAIRLPKDMNDIATALRAGQEFEQTVKLADFNSIRKMLQFELG